MRCMKASQNHCVLYDFRRHAGWMIVGVVIPIDVCEKCMHTNVRKSWFTTELKVCDDEVCTHSLEQFWSMRNFNAGVNHEFIDAVLMHFSHTSIGIATPSRVRIAGERKVYKTQLCCNVLLHHVRKRHAFDGFWPSGVRWYPELQRLPTAPYFFTIIISRCPPYYIFQRS